MPVQGHLPRRRTTRKRGQALVEFAMVLPIFLLVLSAVCDFGFLLFQRMSVINAAREGARAAIMVLIPSTIDTVASGAAIASAKGGGVTPSSVTTACYAGTSTTTKACGTVVSGDSVAVTVHYAYTTFFPLAFGSSIDITSTVQMVME
jgi:Flp pilus assembly protein TadG